MADNTRYFHVLPNANYTVREGQSNAGVSDSTKGLTVQVTMSERATLKGSLFHSEDLDEAKQFAIDYMGVRRQVLSDAVLAIRQTRMHNLLDGSTPGITKAGLMTKTPESVAATAKRREELAKQRAAAEKAAAKKQTAKKPTAKKQTRKAS